MPSAGGDIPPSFSQVVGGSSQSVYITPVRRAHTIDSVTSEVMAAPPPQPPPNYQTVTAAQFEAYWNGLPSEAVQIGAETSALATGNDAIKIACLLHRNNRNQIHMGQVTQQLAAATQTAKGCSECS